MAPALENRAQLMIGPKADPDLSPIQPLQPKKSKPMIPVVLGQDLTPQNGSEVSHARAHANLTAEGFG